MFKKLVDFCNQRVELYGQQYFNFGIFGLINYPLAYLVRVFFEGHPEKESLLLRISAGVLCVPLALHKQIPAQLQKYLPIYWYATLIYSVPFFMSYLSLKNNMSNEWLINCGVGLFILIMVIDWLMFLICSTIGTIFGIAVFLIYDNFEGIQSTEEIQTISIYLYFCIFIIGSIFSKNKQQYHLDIIKRKNKLNKELTKDLEKKSQELVTALDSNKNFVQNISHELRTPTHSILGLAEQMKENLHQLSKDKLSSVVTMIYSSAFTLSEMVNNLIDFSGLRNKKNYFNFKTIDLKKLISQAIETSKIYISATGKNLNISFNYKANTPKTIEADPIRLQQVVNNLLSNAIKYSHDYSKKIDVNVSTEQNDLIKLSISDQGVGIPDGEESVIFNAFIRSTHTKHKNTGKGLGLAIVKEIIKGHNGKIWASQNKGNGATFTFVIPTSQNRK